MSTSISEVETDLDIVEELLPYEPGGPEHLAHIVMPPGNDHLWQPGMDAKELIDIARMTGVEVQALCGHRWVPVRDPGDREICQECLDTFNKIFG